MPWVVVFDTNVLLSAVISPLGNPFRCVALARSGVVTSVTCRQILDEFVEKLQTKFFLTADQSHTAADEVRAYSRIVEVPGALRVISADPDDDVVLECAEVASATHLITGDRHLLTLGNYNKTAILTPADFVRLVASQSEARSN